MRVLPVLLLAALPAAPDSPWVRRDFDGLRADWLAVAPPAFASVLDPLCELRTRSLSVAVVRADDVEAKFGKGAEGLERLVAAVRPRFLLLAGDVPLIPTAVRKAEYVSNRYPSDPDLATDQLFGAMTGRFPADTAEELRTMVAKTVEYEVSLGAGAWQRKLAFVTGEGGFGPLVDAAIERQFTTLVAESVPPGYDVELAYAKPSSPYFYYAPKFNENALRLLNEGPLFYAYVGHGLRTALDDVRYKGFTYPILQEKDAAKVGAEGGGLPIMVAIACNTGEYDSRVGDAIGEALVKRPRGPVAFVGGTRITQPYGNALFGREMIRAVLHERAPTMGEALSAARAAVLRNDGSPLRLQADALATFLQGPGSLEPMRKDVVLHYNLLGDPALPVRRPDETLSVEPRGPAKAGARLAVAGFAKWAAAAEVALEVPRDRFWNLAALEGEDLEAAVRRRYRSANDRTVARASVPVHDGAFEAELALPSGLPGGRYVLKVAAGPGVGASWVDVE